MTGGEGQRRWVGPRGERVGAWATTMHVVAGGCRAVEGRAQLVEDMKKGIRDAAKAIKRGRGKGGAKGGAERVLEVAHGGIGKSPRRR